MLEAGAVLALVVVVFGIFSIRTIYSDHQLLSAATNNLTQQTLKLQQDLAANCKDDEQRLNQAAEQERQARYEARHWQDAYERISRGEMHPDRLLDHGDEDTLYSGLRDIAKNMRPLPVIQIGSVQDREAQRVAFQILRSFFKAKLPITWQKEPNKELKAKIEYSLPVGITIWTDQPNSTGTFFYHVFHDAGLDTSVNPNPSGVWPDLKGKVIIWVGYKQLP